MRLFADDVERSYEGPKRFAEDIFSYYNRSARSEMRRVREVLERWFSGYPVEGRASLRARFRDDFDSAFYELLVHELLCSLGFDVTVHPDFGDGSSRHPDFLARNPGGKDLVVEATLVRDQSDAERGLERVRNVVLDGINKMDSPDFMVDVHIVHWSSVTPSSNKIRAFLEDQFSDLDPDEITECYEQDGWEGVPEFSYSDGDDWLIIFRPIPVKPEKRGRSNRRPIGLLSVGDAASIRPADALRSAIKSKARQYEEPRLPYVIAANTIGMHPPDIGDVVDALMGEARPQYRQSVTRLYEPERGRVPYGSWTGPGGPINRRVSGVLLTMPVLPTNIASAPVILCPNPWARHRYAAPLTRLPQARMTGANVQWITGESLTDILGISEEWPYD